MNSELLMLFGVVVAGCTAAGAVIGSFLGRRRIRSTSLGGVVGVAVGVVIAASVTLRQPQPPSGSDTEHGRVHLTIDHLNIAVRELDKAAAVYEALGFTIKPGRVHENTIDNRHIKFADGTEVELITAEQPTDQQASEYLQIIRHGDGPGFLACRTKGFDATTRAWEKYDLTLRFGMSHGARSATIAPGQPLRPIWLLDKADAKADKQKFTQHANTATGIHGVWYAPYFRNELVSFCQSMGFTPAPAEHAPATEVIGISEGRAFFVVDLPMPVKLRPIIGLSIVVDDIKAVQTILNTNNVTMEQEATEENPAIIVPPTSTHGIWIEFRQL